MLQPVVEYLVKTEVTSYAIVANKKTVSMPDITRRRLLTKDRFNAAARDEYLQSRGIKRPRDDVGASAAGATMSSPEPNAFQDADGVRIASSAPSSLPQSLIQQTLRGLRADEQARITMIRNINYTQQVILRALPLTRGGKFTKQ